MSRARDLADGTFSGEFAADSPTLVVDATNNRVGVGTTTPDSPLEVQINTTTNTNSIRLDNVGAMTVGQGSLIEWRNGTVTVGDTAGISGIVTSTTSGARGTGLAFYTNAQAVGLTEKARIDQDGNLLVGTTDVTIGYTDGDVGFAVDGTNGYFGVARSPSSSTQALAYLNRLNSDGDIVQFRKDGATVGVIGNNGDTLRIGSNGGGSGYLKLGSLTEDFYEVYSAAIYPNVDDVRDLGISARRWDDVYATNGTIQTSDRNEKQDIEALSDAEQRVAVAAKGLLRKYRWKNAVAEKGDAARIHFGIIAQDLQAAFEAEGLDACRYGMFISSTWWEADRVIPAVAAQDAVYETQLDEDGNEVQVLVSEAIEARPERVVTDTFDTLEEAPEGAVQRTRLGVRYPELLAFIIAAL